MKHKNFFIVPNQIFELGLKPKEFVVYCCLLRHSDKNTDNCFPSRRLIANKYTNLRELTPEVLRTFIERIIIHERTAKHSKTASQQIDIYFRYIGKLAPEQVA